MFICVRIIIISSGLHYVAHTRAMHHPVCRPVSRSYIISQSEYPTESPGHQIESSP